MRLIREGIRRVKIVSRMQDMTGRQQELLGSDFVKRYFKVGGDGEGNKIRKGYHRDPPLIYV